MYHFLLCFSNFFFLLSCLLLVQKECFMCLFVCNAIASKLTIIVLAPFGSRNWKLLLVISTLSSLPQTSYTPSMLNTIPGRRYILIRYNLVWKIKYTYDVLHIDIKWYYNSAYSKRRRTIFGSPQFSHYSVGLNRRTHKWHTLEVGFRKNSAPQNLSGRRCWSISFCLFI